MRASKAKREEPTLEELLQKVSKGGWESKDSRATGTKDAYFPRERAPKTVRGRGKKSRPREISSRVRVPVGRERCLGIDGDAGQGRSVRRFDPRFEEHCGDLREEHVERNYEFVRAFRESERKQLKHAVTKNPADLHASVQLENMQQDDLRRKSILRRREILQNLRSEEKEAVKKGKKPFFWKEKDLRGLEVKAKYEELKKKGGVKKYIEKRRKRLASKDRKLLPISRSAK